MTQVGTFPTGLAAGQPENVADVVTALNQIKTVVNGNLDADNLSSASGISNIYRTLYGPTSQAQSLASGTTYVVAANASGVGFFSTAAADMFASMIYIDPADFTAGTKTTKCRLRVALAANATASTSTFTFGLYPITAAAGGANKNTFTLGTVTSGSTVAFATPSASSLNQGNSGDFTAPVAGYFAIGVAVTTATMVANSSIAVQMQLQVRSV